MYDHHTEEYTWYDTMASMFALERGGKKKGRDGVRAGVETKLSKGGGLWRHVGGVREKRHPTNEDCCYDYYGEDKEGDFVVHFFLTPSLLLWWFFR